MNRKDLLGAAILLLIAGAYYSATLRIPLSTLDDGVGPRGFPLVLTIALVIVAIVIAVRALTRVPAGILNQAAVKEVEARWPRALGVLDPHNDYPKNFSGHIRATLKDGTVREVRKPHMRGGAHEPLTDDEIKAKFLDNLQFGGWDARRSMRLTDAVDRIVGGATVDLAEARP
jgi:hypothetical protein